MAKNKKKMYKKSNCYILKINYNNVIEVSGNEISNTELREKIIIENLQEHIIYSTYTISFKKITLIVNNHYRTLFKAGQPSENSNIL